MRRHFIAIRVTEFHFILFCCLFHGLVASSAFLLLHQQQEMSKLWQQSKLKHQPLQLVIFHPFEVLPHTRICSCLRSDDKLRCKNDLSAGGKVIFYSLKLISVTASSMMGLKDLPPSLAGTNHLSQLL